MDLNDPISLEHIIKLNGVVQGIGCPNTTSFEEIYDMFLNTKVTDDLFIELTVI